MCRAGAFWKREDRYWNTVFRYFRYFSMGIIPIPNPFFCEFRYRIPIPDVRYFRFGSVGFFRYASYMHVLPSTSCNELLSYDYVFPGWAIGDSLSTHVSSACAIGDRSSAHVFPAWAIRDSSSAHFFKAWAIEDRSPAHIGRGCAILATWASSSVPVVSYRSCMSYTCFPRLEI